MANETVFGLISSDIVATTEPIDLAIPEWRFNQTAKYYTLYFYNDAEGNVQVPTAGPGSRGTLLLSDNGSRYTSTFAEDGQGGVMSSVNFDLSTEDYPGFNSLAPLVGVRFSVTGATPPFMRIVVTQ